MEGLLRSAVQNEAAGDMHAQRRCGPGVLGATQQFPGGVSVIRGEPGLLWRDRTPTACVSAPAIHNRAPAACDCAPVASQQAPTALFRKL